MTTSDPSDEGSPPRRGQPEPWSAPGDTEPWSALGDTEPWPTPEDGVDASGPGPGPIANTTRGDVPEEILSAPPPAPRTAGSSPDETPTAPQPPLPARQPVADPLIAPPGCGGTAAVGGPGGATEVAGDGGAAAVASPGPGTSPLPMSPAAMYPPGRPEPGLGGRIALVIGLVATFLFCCLAGAVAVALIHGGDL